MLFEVSVIEPMSVAGDLTCHSSQDRTGYRNKGSGKFGEDSHDNEEEAA